MKLQSIHKALVEKVKEIDKIYINLKKGYAPSATIEHQEQLKKLTARLRHAVFAIERFQEWMRIKVESDTDEHPVNIKAVSDAFNPEKHERI